MCVVHVVVCGCVLSGCVLFERVVCLCVELCVVCVRPV